jgi:DNA excision repair protein ERCC-2
MKAQKGDRIVLAGEQVDRPTRDGEVLEVRGKDGEPPYLVRWSDGHTGLLYPGPGSVLRIGHGTTEAAEYRFLAEVAQLMPPTRARLLLQRPDLSDFERQRVLQVLASPPPEGILLFAVSGGMYAEGVDYPGEILSGVFVISPALPQVSFERELLRQYFEEQEEAGFDYAYLQPGMTRVVQAAGRLIRSETDRGVIALLCHRFLEEPYVSRLPRDWYLETPDELVSRRPAEEIREFFESYGR